MEKNLTISANNTHHNGHGAHLEWKKLDQIKLITIQISFYMQHLALKVDYWDMFHSIGLT